MAKYNALRSAADQSQRALGLEQYPGIVQEPPPADATVRCGAVEVTFPRVGEEVISAYRRKRGCDRALCERARTRSIRQAIARSRTDHSLRRLVAEKREADRRFLEVCGTSPREMRQAVGLALAYERKLEEKVRAAAIKRGKSSRRYDDRRSSTSVHTVSGGLPT